jgi:hypothetical protein
MIDLVPFAVFRSAVKLSVGANFTEKEVNTLEDLREMLTMSSTQNSLSLISRTFGLPEFVQKGE